MRNFLIIIFLMLSGCASKDIVNQPFQVDFPIAISPKIQPIAKPVFAVDTVSSKNSMFEQVRALLVANEQHKGYEIQLEAANKACQ